MSFFDLEENMKEIIVKEFDALNIHELYELMKARVDVFVVEQTCPYPELDNVDQDAIHVYIKENNEIKAYSRVFIREGSTIQIGRVLSLERQKHYGYEVMSKAIDVAKEKYKAKCIYIEAQCYAIGFYEKIGFKIISDSFLEDNIPHVKMILDCN